MPAPTLATDAFLKVLRRHTHWLAGGDARSVEVEAVRESDGARFLVAVGGEFAPVVDGSLGAYVLGAGRYILGVVDPERATPAGTLPTAADTFAFLGARWKCGAVERDSVRGGATATYRLQLEALEGKARAGAG